jgi:hypothetical protein
MFTPPSIVSRNTFATVAKKAEQDLCNFLLECIKLEPKLVDYMNRDARLLSFRAWDRKCTKVRGTIKNKYDSKFPNWTNGLKFLDDLLSWLDARKARNREKGKDTPVWPWKRGDNKREIKDPDIRSLLNLFKNTFLDGLCMPRRPSVEQKDLDSVIDEKLTDIWLLMHFIRYVSIRGIPIPTNPWEIHFKKVRRKDHPELVAASNFLSWLLVDKNNKTLYILYSEDEINSEAHNKHEVNTRLEITFLHELGHAINHMDWYENVQPDYYQMGHSKYGLSDWIGVPAWHEFGAWAYAFAVRGCVKSTRSWIKRLVEEMDNEWLNP